MTPNEEESPLALYRIELEGFQGPLDLLLHLIRKNQIDIYDIPIAEVTAQYLGYLDMMRDLNLDVASEFLVMASNLIYIKSRTLLPSPAEEEEPQEPDPREELIRRLLEYSKYRKAAEELGRRPALNTDVFVRPEVEARPDTPEIYVEATLFQLMDAFAKVLSTAEKRRPHDVERDSFTLEEGIAHLEGRLQSCGGSMRFAELFEELVTRRRIVTVFLALLELIKRGRIAAMQPDHGEPLRLLWVKPPAPTDKPEIDA